MTSDDVKRMSDLLQHCCAQSVWLLFIKDCYRPRLSPWMLLVQCTAFFILFAAFFRQAYLRKGRSHTAAVQQNGAQQNGLDHKIE
jgi:hypothetical protein